MNFVILAGGTGTRLWPMSRNDKPKQFAHILSNLSMLEETIARLGVGQSYEKIYISTSKHFSNIIRTILPDFPEDHLIIEPEKRDTGPAYAFVAAHLAQTAPDEPVALIPSDHFIRDDKAFRTALKLAEETILATGKMLDIGIVPTFPNVNLGYTKIGEHLKDSDDVHLYAFAGHTEKPPLDIAKRYVKDGSYLWHASYYMWTPQKLLEAYRKYAPEIGNKIEAVVAAMRAGDYEKCAALYGELPKISIDYAVTEKMDTSEVIIIKGEFGWSDIGSWDQLYEQLADEADEQGNFIHGTWEGIDTSSSLVFGQLGKLVATIGISDLIVVDTPDALLICPRGRAQDVKKIVEKLGSTDQRKYL